MNHLGLSYTPRSPEKVERGFKLNRDNYIPSREKLLKTVSYPEIYSYQYGLLMRYSKTDKAEKLLSCFTNDSFTEYAPEYIEKKKENALYNFDLNMSFFAGLSKEEFNDILSETVSRFSLKEAHNLSKWRMPGIYIMVLDEYKQVFVGYSFSDIARSIKTHWTAEKPLDRLVFMGKESSILSIDSFLMLDTTRVFVLPNANFYLQEKVLNSLPEDFVLNRIARCQFDDLRYHPNPVKRRKLSDKKEAPELSSFRNSLFLDTIGVLPSEVECEF